MTALDGLNDDFRDMVSALRDAGAVEDVGRLEQRRE